DAGYYPAWVFDDEEAALEVTNLTYMLRGLNTILYDNGVGGPYYFDTKSKLKNILEGKEKGLRASAFLTPTLYLDYGNGYSEKDTLHVKNSGIGECLKAVFEWDREKGMPLHVRFDPCERGRIILKKVRISLIFNAGGKRTIPLSKCICNGVVSDDEIRFEKPDPWIDICWKSYRKPVGLEVCAQMSFLETSEGADSVVAG
ncbi:CheF family chemotaxis protein, partial [Lacrimispora sp. NSJ-141]|nr:CheF family chemotaxis protein [Lientehia hominis]